MRPVKQKPNVITLDDYDRELIPSALQDALKKLKRSGFDALLVGGCIRDYLLGYTPKDFDSVTNAKPEQITKVLPRTRVIGRRFRLVQMRHKRDEFEIATYRREARSSIRKKHLHNRVAIPQNAYGNQQEDAFRRDFTINALYFDPRRKEVIDYVDGLKDIEDRLLRCIGPPDVRFKEDPVRILRAARLAAKLDLDIHEDIVGAIHQNKPLLRHVARPRLRDELGKLFLTGHGESSYQKLLELNLMPFVFPQHPDAQEIITQAMIDSDKRLASSFNASIAYLFGIMLWNQYSDELAKLNASRGKKRNSIHLREIATRHVIERAKDYVAVNKIAAEFIVGMFALQHALENKNASKQTLTHPRIRAAVHLLKLRADVGEVDRDLVRWWQRRQPSREKMQEMRRKTRAERPRRRRPPRKRRVKDYPAD